MESSSSHRPTPSIDSSFGYGAFSPAHGWFQLEWPESWSSANIAAKELVPVVIAAAMGPSWFQKCIRFSRQTTWPWLLSSGAG